MWKNTLFVMTVSGTIMCLLYLITYPVAKRYFPTTWRFNVLKMSILFFLLPLGEFKYIFIDIFRWVFPISERQPSVLREEINPEIVLSSNGEVLFLSNPIIFVWITIFLSGIISFIIVSSQLRKYRKIKKSSFVHAKEIQSGIVHAELLYLKKALGIKRNVRIFYSDICRSPMVVGVLTPVIMLPEAEYFVCKGDKLRYVLEHELIHIKHNHLAVKFIALLVIAIHWYNPICYALYFELCNMSEICCDNEVIKKKTEAARLFYGNLILDLALEDRTEHLMPIAKMMSKNAHILKRRILAMKQPVLNPQKLLAGFVGVGMVLLSGISVFAYEPPVKLTTSTSDSYDSNYTGMVSPKGMMPSVESLPYDSFFTDSEGIICDLATDENVERAFCWHKYEAVEYTKHVKLAGNSCKVTVHSAERCTKCGDLVIGAVISTSTHAPCPH